VRLEDTLGPWLGKTTKMLACLIGEVFKENNLDITREQWVFLIKLHQKDGIPQNKLAFITERDKTSLTRLVKTMERKGLITRQSSDKDRRIKLVFLTQKAKKLYKESLPIMQKTIKDLQKNLSEEEIRLTIQVLQKFQMTIGDYTKHCGAKHASHTTKNTD
jgi:DNA-binding MarR family transcriptional regulator